MVVIVAILATGSRGVILAMVIAFGAGWLHRAFTARKLPRGLIAGVCVIICLAASLFFFNLETSRFWDDRFRTATVEARLDAFSAAMQSTSQNHLLGVGSGVSLNAVSDDPLRSVHNAYLQNVLWFGVVGGVVLSVAMWLLPWLAWRINTYTGQACIVKRALAMSILLLLLVNMSQASWEGSVLRVWIYVVVGVGVVLIRGLGEFRARIPAQ